MSVISGNALGGASSYQITNSVRLRAAASAYFSRTFGAPTAQVTFTLSAWVKRGDLGTLRNIFGVSTNNSIGFPAANTLVVTLAGSATITTTALYRDPSAWYHIVYKQTTGAAELYVNGTSVGTSATVSAVFNTAVAHQLGAANTSNYLDGYLSDVYFIDGQALTPSSFGQTDSNGVWVPKAYSGTYGTNGFHLDFKDAALTAGSNAGLGKDVSGNGNYWTTNNISVTAGVTYDSMVDTPTQNYATLNPLLVGGVTLDSANLRNVSHGAASWKWAKVTMPFPTTGKFYFEITMPSSSTGYCYGVVTEAASMTLDPNSSSVGLWGMQATNKYSNGTNTTPFSAPAASSVIGFAYNATTSDLWWSDDGVFVGDPVAGTSPSWTSVPTGVYAAFGCYSTQINVINFGQSPFAYTPPTGFKALCTANLPAVAIPNPRKHFDVKTWTGDGATRSITGIGFAPELIVGKSRSNAYIPSWWDKVRGVSKALASDRTDSEASLALTGGDITAFNSDGWTMQSGSVNFSWLNQTAATYVAWLWKAGGAGVSNTAGTTTSTVSANTTAGFSIVTYNGTAAGGSTVGHGLPSTPKLIFVKRRVDSPYGWPVYHASLTSVNHYLLLNDTAAQANYGSAFISPNSTTFAIDSSSSLLNASGKSYVAYCFADVIGMSKAFSFTGSANADGVYIDLGFLPALVLLKCSGTTGNWYLLDTVRNTYNVLGEQLYPNLANAASTVTTLDVTSRGIKLRLAGDPNAAQTYVGFAWARTPFGGSNVAPCPAF